ncbi:hypothetical protein DYD21_10560 [Rhodohalobacter sp. SW132]|uniref:hypothetical protein n=1 Tax=Rhodohalobacter sp. SW132 TaxID=2293433 RepID=UPI000E231107|nr:hypothetical protein [Rhodohalobacter sp. SW132]REL33838.1 hypothetical protein DYD21_10560 [Rhodohalobacter sp. SW132]
MPEFNPLQQQIRDVRIQVESEKKDVFHAKERLKKLEIRKKSVKRSKGEESNEFEALLDRERELKQVISRGKSQLADTLGQKASLFEEFQPFADPRNNMDKLSDEYPLLLLPVRLETRFKKTNGESGDLQHQLWVRIFPDECSIDTFDETLSESELQQIKNYWISIWKAGKPGNDAIRSYVKEKEIGAWRKLMGFFNAGRSYWLTQQYKPVNTEQNNNDKKPKRNTESDILLVVPTEELPATEVRDALSQYWQNILLAGDDAGAKDEAFEQLTDALAIDDEAASRLTEQYKPQNIDLEEPSEDVTSDDISVAFLHFPKTENTDTKLTAWAQAAKVSTFPEKFVLLGFHGDNSEPVINELGERIPDPLIVGPDTRDDVDALLRDVYGDEFDELSDDEKAVKYIEYLSGQAETKWLFNFDEAVDMGLGFKVDLTKEQYDRGFDRLFVLGVKIAADEQQGKAELENLIRNHHYGDNGFSILPQGTPTNNTEDDGSGYSESEDAEEAYERYFEETNEDDPHERSEKRDGRWLAELLGIDIDEASLKLVENYYQTDQREASDMNTALWNATIGYFLESMVTPTTNEWERDLTRWFLINHVRGRGRFPSIRVGDQPYGILPVSTISDLKWLDQPRTSFARDYSDHIPVLQDMYSISQKVRTDWEDLVKQVAYVGKEGDAHQLLLQALGLHATSVEFDRRVAQSFLQHINSLKLKGQSDDLIKQLAEFFETFYKARGIQLLEDLGYNHDMKEDPQIPILEKLFLTAQEDVEKPMIDDNPLSETNTIRAYTETGQNYIEWLIENARENHRNIRNQRGFADNKKPDALLYDMLRHALNLEFGNTSLNLYRNAEILNRSEAAFARIDTNFIDVEANKAELQSKWDLIYRKEDRIAGDTMIADHISELLKTNVVTPQSGQLHEVVAALERLKDVPTARLERCFAEHLDCCSYRLDAWMLGFLHLQLHAMRFGSENNDENAKEGIYLGAYGFVEDLRPKEKTLTPYEPDPDLRDFFDPEGKNDITKDDTNAGYVLAPSINHGLTAAVLRNAYISNASELEKEIFKVNLSSERVRMAMEIIEGMQEGQSLGALLGYQLERGLHDNNDEELDVYIYELRKVFPLISNRMESTAVGEDEDELDEDRAVGKIEARNVVDGLSLLEHVKKTGNEIYPFGFPFEDRPVELKSASSDEEDAINAEVQRLMNIRDAIADVAMAESVHQVVQGNYDRAGGALDAYSKGDYPQLPDVVQSPGSGTTLTHRFGVHLPSGIDPASGVNPRSKAEPAVNAWLENVLPSVSDISCVITYRIPDYKDDDIAGADVEETLSMDDLGLVPIDLLYMLSVESEKNLTALDEYILQAAYREFGLPPHAVIEINYTQLVENKVTFFEIASIVSDLRTLIVSSRPLRPTDVMLQNEASEEQDAAASIDTNRITLVKDSLENILDDLKANVIDKLDALIDEEDLEVTMGNKSAILANFDIISDEFIDHLSRLGRFGLPGAGFGHVYDRKRAVYNTVYEEVVKYKKRWNEKLDTYDDLVNNRLPVAVDDDEKIEILLKAERVISTQYTGTVSSLTDLKTNVDDKKDDFDDKYTELQNFLTDSHANISDLLEAVINLKIGLNSFDHMPLETDEDEKQVVILSEDILKQAVRLHKSVSEDLAEVDNLKQEAEEVAATDEKINKLTEAARLMLGDDFVMVPEFWFGADHETELQNFLKDPDQLLDYQINEQSNDFPVDDWLYGVARVREKLSAWESLVMTAEGIKDQTLNLTPVQLPYIENDSWLGLSYPSDLEIESDKLLYTAYMPGFNPSESQCGLMVDEWTEVIPAKDETSGLTFHYDRPNCEPPQTMLMVTPSAFTGEWTWKEIVESLHETLDLAKLRAVEPDQIDRTGYTRFLPATIATMTVHPVTMFLNYGIKANLETENPEDNG